MGLGCALAAALIATAFHAHLIVILGAGVGACFAVVGVIEIMDARKHRRAIQSAPAGAAGAAGAVPPVDVKITSTQRADWLLLDVQNNGATARFRAEVLVILRKELSGAIEPSQWPVPWRADGKTGTSIAPAEIPAGQTGTLDFATYDPDAVNTSRSGNVGGYHWRFTSVPLLIGVMYYPPIKSLSDLSSRRFVVTIRILRSEPRGHMDRTFEVGSSGGQELVCEPVPLKVTILDRDWKDWHLRHFIVSVLVRVENTTARTIRLAPVFWLESDSRDVPPPDRDDPKAIRQDISKEQERRTPSLFDRLEIPPHDRISGWVVHWVSRSEHYGKPHCWLILRDEVGGVYPVRIEPES